LELQRKAQEESQRHTKELEKKAQVQAEQRTTELHQKAHADIDKLPRRIERNVPAQALRPTNAPPGLSQRLQGKQPGNKRVIPGPPGTDPRPQPDEQKPPP
jgi:hypothetical protein